MSDYTIGALLFMFLVALAIAAPIWGVDSRDGIESDQSARRVAWLAGSTGVSSLRQFAGQPRSQSASIAIATVLRSVAQRLDNEAAEQRELGRRLAHA